jgi:adhesin transport system outer membrane protein
MVSHHGVRRSVHLGNSLLSSCVLVAVLCGHSSVSAASLSDVFLTLIERAPRTLAATADMSSTEQRLAEVTRRAWAPQFEANVSGGSQRYEKPNAPIVNVHDGYSQSLRITQLITDFGRSSKSIEENRFVNEQNKTGLDAMKQGVSLDAFVAYLSVQRALKVLEYALMSEKNIKEQAQIEDAMVEAGRGYVSNVLQAKAQLAGAQARRVRAEGAHSVALYRVKAVFADLAQGMTFDQVIPPAQPLPTSLEAAIEEANNNSLQIKLGSQRTSALAARKESVKSREFLPRLQLLVESRRASNMDGILGLIKDDRSQLQLNYPLNLGFAGSAAVDGVQHDINASYQREVETKNLVFEQVAISWRNLQTARDNRDNLTNQVRLAKEFLEIAREERAVGKRNLLDVLSAETNLINAQSDLASTEFDVVSAGYTLLQAMGRLDAQAVQTALTVGTK